MKRTRLYVVAALVCACCVAVALTLNRDRPRQHDASETGPRPFLAAEVKLPEVPFAQPLGAPDRYTVFVNVNSKGQMVLPPEHRESGQETLETASEIEAYLKRIAKIELAQTTHDRPEGTIALRIDRDAPFGKAYPVMKACRSSYENIQLRVVRSPEPSEGQVALIPPRFVHWNLNPDPGVEKSKTFVLRANATKEGTLDRICFREHHGPDSILQDEVIPDAPGEVIGADVPPALTTLRSVAEAEKTRRDAGGPNGLRIEPPALILEVDEKLLQASVVQLLEASLQAGFAEVWPVPIDVRRR